MRRKQRRIDDRRQSASATSRAVWREIEDALPSCEANGILGPVTGVIGTLMAMGAIKLITGMGKPLIGRLLVYDAREASFTALGY